MHPRCVALGFDAEGQQCCPASSAWTGDGAGSGESDGSGEATFYYYACCDNTGAPSTATPVVASRARFCVDD